MKHLANHECDSMETIPLVRSILCNNVMVIEKV